MNPVKRVILNIYYDALQINPMYKSHCLPNKCVNGSASGTHDPLTLAWHKCHKVLCGNTSFWHYGEKARTFPCMLVEVGRPAKAVKPMRRGGGGGLQGGKKEVKQGKGGWNGMETGVRRRTNKFQTRGIWLVCTSNPDPHPTWVWSTCMNHRRPAPAILLAKGCVDPSWLTPKRPPAANLVGCGRSCTSTTAQGIQ